MLGTIKDGDGDLSHTTLTISIGDATPTVGDLTPQGSGGDTTVNEKGLPASSGSEGSGELAADIDQPGGEIELIPAQRDNFRRA